MLAASEHQSWLAKAVVAVIVAAGMLVSTTGVANAATSTSSKAVTSAAVVSTGASLPANVITEAAPYVVVSGHHATVKATAKQHLTAAEYTAVTRSVARFNSEPASLQVAVTKSGFSSSLAKVHSNSVRPMDGCTWSWSWDDHWYGWTFYMNDCAVNVIDGALWTAGGVAAAIAAFQAYLDVPYDIAAIIGAVVGGAGAGALALQESSCEAAGYGGVGYGDLWVDYVYAYC